MAIEKKNEILEDMQLQIDLLKKKLEKETIVNESLMRTAMSHRVSSIERYLLKVLTLGVVGMLLLAFDFIVLFPLSVWFVVVTEIMLACCIAFICWNKRLVCSDKIMSGNLVEEGRRLVRFKKREMRYICVSIPLSFVWMVWLVFEIYTHIPDKEEMYGILTGCLIGGIIGFIIGLRMFRSMLRNVNDVLGQIDELMEAE